MYDKQRRLTINFKNGLSKTITPVRGKESFLDLSQSERDNISSLRFVLGDQTFTISRKIDDNTEAQGFFYHIMQGKKVILGENSGQDTPLVSERIGFCYHEDGSSSAIIIDYIKGNVEFVDENIIYLGVNIELFHDLKDKKAKFWNKYTAYRAALIQHLEHNEPLIIEALKIPYLDSGHAPRVLFNSKDVTNYHPRK